MAMETYFSQLRPNPHKRIELTTNEAVKQAILAGLGYSILPVIGIRHELLSHQLHVIAQPGLPLLTKWRLIWREDRQLSPVAQAYLDHLRKAKDRIVKNCFRWYANFR